MELNRYQNGERDTPSPTRTRTRTGSVFTTRSVNANPDMERIGREELGTNIEPESYIVTVLKPPTAIPENAKPQAKVLPEVIEYYEKDYLQNCILRSAGRTVGLLSSAASIVYPIVRKPSKTIPDYVRRKEDSYDFSLDCVERYAEFQNFDRCVAGLSREDAYRFINQVAQQSNIYVDPAEFNTFMSVRQYLFRCSNRKCSSYRVQLDYLSWNSERLMSSLNKIEKVYRYERDIWFFLYKTSQDGTMLSVDLERLTDDQDKDLMIYARDALPLELMSAVPRQESWAQFRHLLSLELQSEGFKRSIDTLNKHYDRSKPNAHYSQPIKKKYDGKNAKGQRVYFADNEKNRSKAGFSHNGIQGTHATQNGNNNGIKGTKKPYNGKGKNNGKGKGRNRDPREEEHLAAFRQSSAIQALLETFPSLTKNKCHLCHLPGHWVSNCPIKVDLSKPVGQSVYLVQNSEENLPKVQIHDGTPYEIEYEEEESFQNGNTYEEECQSEYPTGTKEDMCHYDQNDCSEQATANPHGDASWSDEQSN